MTNSPQLNRFELLAALVSKTVLRYTPAGVPVCEIVLAHESVQIEASHPRKVVCEVEAIVLGPLANQVSKMDLGSMKRWCGFLALRSHKQKKLQLHVCSVFSQD